MSTIASIGVDLYARTAGFQSDMNRAARIAKRKNDELVGHFKAAGVAIGAAAVAMGTAIVAATEKAGEFESAIAEVATLLGDDANTNALAASVHKLSMEFGQTQTETAAALYQAISSGATTAKEQNDLMVASGKLAVGGLADMETAMSGMTTVLEAYGLGTESAGLVSDQLFATMRIGKTDIGQLSGSIGLLAGTASAFGVKMAEMNAAVAVVSLQAPSTSQAITQIKAAINALAAPTEAGAKIAEKYGISIGKTAIQTHGFGSVINDVMDKVGNSPDEMRKLLGSTEAVNAVLAMGAGDGAGYAAAIDQVAASAGEAEKAYDRMANTYDQKKKVINSAIDSMVIQFGDAFLPIMSEVATEFADWVSEVAASGRLVPIFGGFALSFVTVAGKVVLAIANMKMGFEGIGTVLGLLVATGAAMASAIGATFTNLALVLKTTFFTPVATAFAALKDGDFAGALAAAGTFGVDLGGALAAAADGVETGFKAKMAANMDAFKGEISDAATEYNALKSTVETATASIETIIADGVAASSAALAGDGGLTDALGEVSETAENVAVPAMQSVGTAATDLADEISKPGTGVAAVIEKTWQDLDGVFQNVWDDLLKDGSFSMDSLVDMFKGMVAKMLHVAITQPIMLRMGAAMGLGGASGSAMAGGGPLGLADMMAGFGGPLIGAGIGGMIGAGGSSSEQWGSTIGGAIGGIGAVSGALSNFVVGNLWGTSIGSMLTPILGVVAPLIGPLIGAVLGKAIGKLLARDPEVTFQGANFAPIEEQSLFGGFDVRARGGTGPQSDPNSFAGQAVAAIREFDDALGSFMSEGQIAKIVDAMAGWRVNLKNSAVTIENLLESRFAVVLSTFSETAQQYVRSFDGLEAQTQALAEWVTAFNTMSEVLAAYIESGLPGALEQVAQQTSTEKLTGMATGLRDLFESFSGTPEEMQAISAAIDERYRAELEYINAIDALVKSIGASIDAQRARLTQGTALEETVSWREAATLAKRAELAIASATSPEEVAALVTEAQRWIDVAASGYQAVNPEGFADYLELALLPMLDRLQAASDEKLGILRQAAIDESMLLREEAAAFAAQQHIDLEAIQVSADATVVAIHEQTDQIVDGNAAVIGAIHYLGGEIAKWGRISQLESDVAGAR